MEQATELDCNIDTAKLCSDPPDPIPPASIRGNIPRYRSFPRSPALPERKLIRNLLLDQRTFWLSPFRLQEKDAAWLIPSAGVVLGIFGRDTEMSRNLTLGPQGASRANTFSTAGVAMIASAAGGFYLIGRKLDDERMRETGWLSGEAMVDALAAGYAFKYVFGRERPFTGSGRGGFFSGGDSFPSLHSLLAWSGASVIAHEYPDTFTKTIAYGLATAIAAARVAAGQHYVSDVVLGGAIGWGVGRQVYRSHHKAELGGDDIGVFTYDEKPPTRESIGSVGIPLDHWAYDAVDRLVALGYVSSAIQSARPWPRMEFERIVEEADDKVRDNVTGTDPSVVKLLNALKLEFSEEAALMAGDKVAPIQLESIYTRVMGIAGTPLRDGYHFSQTVAYDYGRPYGEGVNFITGFSTRATYNQFSFYFRGEYQHAPVGPIPGAAAQQAIGVADALASGSNPVLFQPPAVPFPAVNQFQVLDAMVSINLWKYQISAGQQSLWYGPGKSGGFLMSNNAEPMLMVRLSNPNPQRLPGILEIFGPVSTEIFLGRLTGYTLETPNIVNGDPVPQNQLKQPFVSSERFTMKPTPNLELGFGNSSVFAGTDFPLNLRSIFRSCCIQGNAAGATDPGDRRTTFTFSYRIPYLRNWLTLYTDSFNEDNSTPILFPRLSAMNPGLYLSHVPRFSKLDLRVEGFYTNVPGLLFPYHFYFNEHYRSGYTNDGNIMGNIIGREGTGYQIWSTWHFSAKDYIETSFRHSKTDPQFLEGGTQSDAKVTFDFPAYSGLEAKFVIQYERWLFPLLATLPQHDVMSSIELVYRPEHHDRNTTARK